MSRIDKFQELFCFYIAPALLFFGLFFDSMIAPEVNKKLINKNIINKNIINKNTISRNLDKYQKKPQKQ
jgi:hypothetical protein